MRLLALAAPTSRCVLDAPAAQSGLFQKGRVPYNKGKEISDSQKLKLTLSRMRAKIDCTSYTDIKRLLFLTRQLRRHYRPFKSKEGKEAFVNRFYFDRQFIAIFDAWRTMGVTKWRRPSLDHKTPLSRGGGFDLDNLHYVTWFENNAKGNMTLEEWYDFRRSTGTRSSLFWPMPDEPQIVRELCDTRTTQDDDRDRLSISLCEPSQAKLSNASASIQRTFRPEQACSQCSYGLARPQT